MPHMGLTGPYRLVTRPYDVALDHLDAAYEGFRILHVSDVHNAAHELAGGLGSILDAARAARPHLIALTGDLMDRRVPNPDDACALVRGLAQIAPTYYVSGNHERTPFGPDGMPLPYRDVQREAEATRARQGDGALAGKTAAVPAGSASTPEGACPHSPASPGDLFTRHRARLEAAGAIVLEGRNVALAPDGAPCETTPDEGGLVLCGVRDPWPLVAYDPESWDRLLADVAGRARSQAGERGAVVLLSHRPERIEAYARAGLDLALTGHAHGGQVRLPGIGALVAPNQGLFPRYARGLYRVGPTSMVVSSGVGTTGYRLRLLCPPEVVLVRLRCGCGVQNESTQR